MCVVGGGGVWSAQESERGREREKERDARAREER